MQVKKVGDKEIVYRKLTEADLDTFIGIRITQLTEEYTVEGREVPKNVDLVAAHQDFYHRHMADGTFVSWLAFDGDKIIGTSGMSFVEKPPYFTCPTGRIGLLSSMFTNPDYRRMGIAKDLLDHVVDEAKDYGCGAVWITASNMGVKLYTAYGFEHNGNYMAYKL
ncbi:MAG: GNAT family N-acetyltransferase [Lachnospiraceae bacterium]|nr:GNAT family N-acetyltransferase [Lachnospiraceae bacterium]